jgi:hypothetical protein
MYIQQLLMFMEQTPRLKLCDFAGWEMTDPSFSSSHNQHGDGFMFILRVIRSRVFPCVASHLT